MSERAELLEQIKAILKDEQWRCWSPWPFSLRCIDRIAALPFFASPAPASPVEPEGKEWQNKWRAAVIERLRDNNWKPHYRNALGWALAEFDELRSLTPSPPREEEGRPPAECVLCGKAEGPPLPLDSDCPEWICQECYLKCIKGDAETARTEGT